MRTRGMGGKATGHLKEDKQGIAKQEWKICKKFIFGVPPPKNQWVEFSAAGCPPPLRRAFACRGRGHQDGRQRPTAPVGKLDVPRVPPQCVEHRPPAAVALLALPGSAGRAVGRAGMACVVLHRRGGSRWKPFSPSNLVGVGGGGLTPGKARSTCPGATQKTVVPVKVLVRFQRTPPGTMTLSSGEGGVLVPLRCFPLYNIHS